VKKLKKIGIKKITLQDLDGPTLDAVAGAHPNTVKPYCATNYTQCEVSTCLIACSPQRPGMLVKR